MAADILALQGAMEMRTMYADRKAARCARKTHTAPVSKEQCDAKKFNVFSGIARGFFGNNPVQTDKSQETSERRFLYRKTLAHLPEGPAFSFLRTARA